jgi:F0F1-type ATP synthase epsilon subunit
MQVSVLEPQGLIYEGKAKEVILPVEEGVVTILDFHQPFLYRLRKGLVRIAGRREPLVIKHGLAIMRGNELTVFVET